MDKMLIVLCKRPRDKGRETSTAKQGRTLLQ